MVRIREVTALIFCEAQAERGKPSRRVGALPPALGRLLKFQFLKPYELIK